MNIQDEIDRLQTAARVANERTREWQAVADRQRGEIDQFRAELDSERRAHALTDAARKMAERRVSALRAAAYALSESAARPVGYDPDFVLLVDRVCLAALRAALRAGEGEDYAA